MHAVSDGYRLEETQPHPARETSDLYAALWRSQAASQFGLDGTLRDANGNFVRPMDCTRRRRAGAAPRMFVDDPKVNSAHYRACWQKPSRGAFASGAYLRLGKDGKRV